MKMSTIRVLAILSIGSVAVAAQDTTVPPTPVMTPWREACNQVSVDGDAIFCIDGPICSGSGAQPAGSMCPKAGDRATAACWDYFTSFADGRGCVAPVDAQCTRMNSGVWGCAWSAGDHQSRSGSTSSSGSSDPSTTLPIDSNTNTTTTLNPEDVQIPKTFLPAVTKGV